VSLALVCVERLVHPPIKPFRRELAQEWADADALTAEAEEPAA
jgi:hypothetical protein